MAEYDYLFKIVLSGDSGVGKTCFLSRFTNDSFTESYIATIGVDFSFRTVTVNGKVVKLQVWDNSGQERFKTITSAYYRAAHGVLMFYDVTNQDSFTDLSRRMADIDRLNDKVTKLLVGTKYDLTNQKMVESGKAEEFAVQAGIPLIETSAKNSDNVDKAFLTLVTNILEKLDQSDPSKAEQTTSTTNTNSTTTTTDNTTMSMSKKVLETVMTVRHADPAVAKLTETLKLARESGTPDKVVNALQETLDMVRQRDQFVVDMTNGESEVCARIHKETMSHDWQKAYDDKKTTWNCKPVMISGQLEGQFLKSFLSAQKAKRVLEVGMFTGYSAITMAEALPADGQIVTLDMDEYLKELVEDLIKDSPHKHKVQIVIGKAVDSMAQMRDNRESFDAIFLDAAKNEYEQYLKMCFEGNLLRPGGTVLVDNAFGFGRSYLQKESVYGDFGNLICSDSDLHVTLVPIRDGIYIIRRKCDVEGSAA